MAEVPGQRERSGVPTGGDALESDSIHITSLGKEIMFSVTFVCLLATLLKEL